MNMSLRPLSRVCFAVGVLCGLLAGAVTAEEAAESVKPTTREMMHDDRPQTARGWLVVSKQSYWPLCYESLDRIEEARALFGSENHDELADTLDKCGAWLKLAASAAMTDGTSGVVEAGDRFTEVAGLIRTGDAKVQKADLDNLATLGLVCMAKSHIMRAADPDVSYQAKPQPRRAKNPSTEILAAEREIAAENVKRARDQYRYDTVESRKHLVVAQAYLNAAAEAGGFSVKPALTKQIPAVPTVDVDEYVDDEIRSRITSMLEFVEGKRLALSKALEANL